MGVFPHWLDGSCQPYQDPPPGASSLFNTFIGNALQRISGPKEKTQFSDYSEDMARSPDASPRIV
jgi:hypothetical protein